MQTVFGYPDGNCLMACICSILEIDLEDAPTIDHRNWWKEITEFCHKHGRHPVYTSRGEMPEGMAPKGFAIAGGQSPREIYDDQGKRILHAVVYKDGIRTHDPHPDKTGIEGPVVDWTILLRTTKEQ